MRPCWIAAIVLFICILSVAFILHSYFVIPMVIQTYTERQTKAQLAQTRLQSLQNEFASLEVSENSALQQLRSQFNGIQIPPSSYDGRIDTQGKKTGQFNRRPPSRVEQQSGVIDRCYENLAACLTYDATQMSPCQNNLTSCLNGDTGIQDKVNSFIDGTAG